MGDTLESIFRGTGGLEFGILWYKDVQGPFQRLRADLPKAGGEKPWNMAVASPSEGRSASPPQITQYHFSGVI